MKYSVLDDFKVFLHSKYKSRATVKQYHFWAARLLDGQFFVSTAGVDMASMTGELERKTKNRNEYSQAKNALLKFADFAKTSVIIPDLSKPKRRRNRKLKHRKLATITKKINAIHDKKLSLSYKIMLATGLRVGELANIRKDNINPLENGGFSLEFIQKRGGKGIIELPAGEQYICKEVAKIISELSRTNKAFYSIGHLQRNAKKRGFACHDLRRAFAKIIHSGNGRKLKETSKKMRHQNPRTTKIYLKSKVEVV